MKGYTGQVTMTGKPVVAFHGKTYQIPQRGISSSLSLRSSTSHAALNRRWTAEDRAKATSAIGLLAKGSIVASAKGSVGAAVNPDGPNSQTQGLNREARRTEAALDSKREEERRVAKAKAEHEAKAEAKVKEKKLKDEEERRRIARDFRAIKTHRETVFQSSSIAALEARKEVMAGRILYRKGTTDKSSVGRAGPGEAQYWALEHPSTPGYDKRHGVPETNVRNQNFVERAKLIPGKHFVTREAPPADGEEGGGAIEVVVPEGSVEMQSFSHGGNRKK